MKPSPYSIELSYVYTAVDSSIVTGSSSSVRIQMDSGNVLSIARCGACSNDSPIFDLRHITCNYSELVRDKTGSTIYFGRRQMSSGVLVLRPDNPINLSRVAQTTPFELSEWLRHKRSMARTLAAITTEVSVLTQPVDPPGLSRPRTSDFCRHWKTSCACGTQTI